MASGRVPLSPTLQRAVLGTAVIDLLIGLAFLLGPELNLTLWPSPIAPVLMRFIGAIVLGNGFGALLVARQGTWEGARALFTVALVYGMAVFFGLLYHLLRNDANQVFWGYVIVDAIFLLPILYIFYTHERQFRSQT